MKCQNCNKEIERGKWCSDKCRKEFARIQETGVLPGIDTEFVEYRKSKGLDWNFGEVMVKKCDCGKEFRTRLALMPSCSFKCHPIYKEMI